MADYVRVRDNETGHHVSILRSHYDFNPSVWTELKSPATYADGTPVAPKFKTAASTETDKQADQSAANSNKEN